MKTVKWGMIGAGSVTEVKSGPAFSKIDNSELVMVMRRDLDKVKDYAARHNIPRFTNNTDDILHNPEIDAVYIATPPSSHLEYTVRAAKAGKHVYVEKPMAISHDECTKMVEVCKTNGVKLFVAYYRRELEYFKKIKEMIEQDIIGRIKYVDIKLILTPNLQDYKKEDLPWRVDAKIAGAGYFYDLASHQLDFLDLLFGPIKSAKGNSTNQLHLYEVEDIISASFLFESNIVGGGLWCFTSESGEEIDQTTIVGSKGKILFSYFKPDPIEVTTTEKSYSISIDYPRHVQQPLVATIVSDILGKGRCLSTGDSGARTNWVLGQILEK